MEEAALEQQEWEELHLYFQVTICYFQEYGKHVPSVQHNNNKIIYEVCMSQNNVMHVCV